MLPLNIGYAVGILSWACPSILSDETFRFLVENAHYAMELARGMQRLYYANPSLIADGNAQQAVFYLTKILNALFPSGELDLSDDEFDTRIAGLVQEESAAASASTLQVHSIFASPVEPRNEPIATQEKDSNTPPGASS